jgi:hypothetical protein
MRIRDVCVSMLIAAVVAQAGQAAQAAQLGQAAQVAQAVRVAQAGRAGQGGLAAIDGCLKHLDPQSGSDEVAVRCPELIRRLEASDSAAWLPAGWAAPSNDLSAARLIDLRQLIAHQLLLRTTSPPPDLAALKSILIELGSTDPRATGAWARFTRWLREALERGDAAPASSWWDTARANPSQVLIDLICYGCLAAVVIMAVALIVNELRLAGAFARRPERMGGDARRAAVAVAVASDWGAIQNAPTRDRPRLLLELIAARLMELDRLPPAGGFTVRELLQQARLSQGEDRSLLADVALAAERVRFSEEPMSAASLETAVEGGRRLLEHLSS